uniref:Nuclear Testis protein N-terminal domain-containing protein n=1 Tax=Saimiri boliviensis boliviensis TaxID=39432 RepID=A0A2K6U098_SAIBB
MEVEALCSEPEGQFKSCLKRHTLSALLPVQLEGNLSSCRLPGALHRMSPTPTKCLGSCVLNLFISKFSLIYLNSGESVEAVHSLGPALDFSHHGNCQTAVISTQPKGMASNGGESVGTGHRNAGDTHGPPTVLSSLVNTVTLRTRGAVIEATQWLVLMFDLGSVSWRLRSPPQGHMAGHVWGGQGPGVGTRWAWDGGWAHGLGLTALPYSPVLRSLARQKPSMTLEEGLWQAMREWQLTSSFDQMIYYEMAGKFLEFEAEEEMQIQKSKWMKGSQCLPPPAPPRLEPQGPSAPQVVKQPGTASHVPTGATAKPQRPAETKAPEEIPPEVVQEYVDIMEELLGPPTGAIGELPGQREEGEVEQEGDGMLLDPGLLNYADNLCSQKDFVTKVEAVIHPRFLEELLSPDPQMDFLALSQELEQEEGLTLAQVAEKRRLSLKEERCARAAPGHGTAQLDSISSESAVGQGAERDVPGPQQGVSVESCPLQTVAWDPQGRGRAEHNGIARSKSPVVLLERLDSCWLRAARPYSPPQDQRPTCPGVGTKDTWGLPGASPVKESHRLSKGLSEEERESPAMVSVVGTNYRLRPWKLSQSPVPASGLLSPEGWGPQGALQSQSAKRRGLSPTPAPATKSKKRALFGGPSPHLGPGLRVSGVQSLAWGLGGPSRSQKRKGDPLLSKRKKKQHRSQ